MIVTFFSKHSLEIISLSHGNSIGNCEIAHLLPACSLSLSSLMVKKNHQFLSNYPENFLNSL